MYFTMPLLSRVGVIELNKLKFLFNYKEFCYFLIKKSVSDDDI